MALLLKSFLINIFLIVSITVGFNILHIISTLMVYVNVIV
jgi:hypothetical protein